MNKLSKKPFLHFLSYDRGFTLIELLIIITIMSILSSIMFGSQYSIREQVYLFQDQYKVIDLINKAKSMTLSAYMRDPLTCGYGVSFENNNGINEVILFKDKKETAQTDCNSIQHFHEYNPEGPSFDEKIESDSFRLNPMNNFMEPGLNHKIGITFNAPALNAFLTKDRENVSDLAKNVSVSFSSVKANIPVSVNVNRFGQINVGTQDENESDFNR